MALLVAQDIDEDGLIASYDAATGGGDTFNNDGHTFLHVKNGHSSPQTVTVAAAIASTDKPGFGALAKVDAQVSVPNGVEAFLGPFPSLAFGSQPAITYSGVIALVVAVLRI